MRHYGIGPLTSVTILAELGDARRFSSSREAVRYSGLDITVHQADTRRAPGRLSRQGPSALRWALFEAAQCARRPGSPDHAYYLQTAARLGGNRACLAVAHKLLKGSYHTCENSARRPCSPHDRRSARAALTHADAARPAPGMLLPPPPGGRPS
jgi:transposase